MARVIVLFGFLAVLSVLSSRADADFGTDYGRCADSRTPAPSRVELCSRALGADALRSENPSSSALCTVLMGSQYPPTGTRHDCAEGIRFIAFSSRGDAYAATGALAQAITDYSFALDRRAVALFFDYRLGHAQISELYQKRAEAHLRLNDFNKGIDDFIESGRERLLSAEQEGKTRVKDAYAQQLNKLADMACMRGHWQAMLKAWNGAADLGSATAASMVARMPARDHGAAQAPGEAARWYQTAAAQGMACAQYRLGKIHHQGQGVPQDAREAAKWMRLAADQSLPDAQYTLAVMYLNGQGVEKNAHAAVDLMQKAADQGFVDAQYGLGLMYFEGLGVAPDLVKSQMWFTLSAWQGDNRGAQARAAVAEKMTPAQLDQANGLVRNWIAQYQARRQ